uniref:EamA domain-containing protein n=1 Tax=Tetradesmus obliquus TaxID=3088 RepID=A0A383VLI0_TETOB|eukprot:jgi/Sobl393_1/14128/SZX65750.1
MTPGAAHQEQQHWDGVLWPGKLASTAGYRLQADEEDDVRFKQQPLHPAATDLEAEQSPFEQQQQQPGHDVTALQVEADSSRADTVTFIVGDEADEAKHGFAALPRLLWSSGRCCMLCAAFIFSLSALFVKLTAGRVPVLQITLIRSGLSFLVSTGIIKSRGIQPMFGQRQHVGWLIARGVTGALAMISFYAAILMLPLADAMTLFFLNPCMTALAAWAIRGEPLGLLGVAGCAWSILGLVLITHPPMLFGGHADWGPKRVMGTLLGVTSAVFATGAFICIRFVGKAEPAIVVALYFHTSTMLLSAVPLLLRWPSPAAWLSWLDGLLLVGVAATSFAGQLFLTRGFQLLPAGKAAGFNFSQVVYSYAFGIFFFHEHLSLFGVAGTALIALGMACVTARTAPQQQQQQQRQGDQIKLSDEARDAAGAGLGSRMFSRILQLDSLQQQQQQDGSLRSSSSSFLTRMQSFQRLLADRRRGEGSADSGGYQYHAAGSSEAEGVGLLPQVQERSSEHASGLAGAAAGHAAAAAAAAAGSGSGSQSMASRLLAVEEQAREQQQVWGPSSSLGPTQPEAVAAAARDVESVATGALEHRHVPQQHLYQQQQHPWTAVQSGAPGVAADGLTGDEVGVMRQQMTG